MTLAEYLAAWPGFDWRTSNCAHFAGRWAGVDLSAVTMPETPQGVRGTLRSVQAQTVRDAVVKFLGAEIAPLQARPGDVVMCGRVLGICNGRTFVAPVNGPGVAFIGMEHADAAWRRP